MINKFIVKICPDLNKYYSFIMTVVLVILFTSLTVMAIEETGENMWTVGTKIIKDVYKQIAGISTILAGLMSAVAVVGAKMSNNQHKVDQAWDWLKRIWIAWAVINGIGAFIAYVSPLLNGWNNLDGTPSPSSSPSPSSGVS